MEFEDNERKANEFNKFFANVGKNTLNYMQNSNTKFRPKPVTVDAVVLVIKSLNESNAFGCDGITLRFVRDALPVIAFYVTVIVDTSIVTGTNSRLWKHGQIAPQFKSGDPDEPCNYRPITLLPILSKVLERIVAIQLVEYLESNRLLSNNQHGFRAKLSTETALMRVTDEIYRNMDKRKITVLSLCDLSKAFDSINHEMLLQKLVSFNIDIFWFDDYLKDRTQSVRLGNIESDKVGVTFGVPQGSILGPILFLIFINDISTIASDCLLVQYADDGQIIHSGTIDDLPELIRRVENTLSLAKTYFDKNGLLVNAKKTQILFIGNRQLIAHIPPNTAINYDNHIITPIKHAKNLGVYFDCFMSFDIHIDELSKKVMGLLIYLK